MQTRTYIAISLALAIGGTFAAASTVRAQTHDAATAVAPTRAGPRLSEIPDAELAAMRGRFMIGSNTVAYFGVTMASTWVTASGQQLSGSVVIGMHFGPDGQIPVITFTPTMNIMQGTPLPAIPADGVTRSVDGSGLANINGLVQGIQIAGDGNRAVNVTSLRISSGTDDTGMDVATSTTQAFDSETSADDARVAVAFDPAQGVSLTLGVDGQGLVSQWIRSGSVGQLVQITSDGQSVNNQLSLDLVLGGQMASIQAMRAASQALLQARMNGSGG
jgi:hypothetical protein